MSIPELIPGATWRPSVIGHPDRPMTLGITIHWTAGREPGDLAVLRGPNVDVTAYVAKDGGKFQMTPLDSQTWHAFHTANTYCVGIETEGSGEPWTDPQLASVADVTAFLCRRYGIPVKHVDPSGHDLDTFRGIFGHRDLSLGGIRVDGNDHTDTVPDGTGWPVFLAAVAARMPGAPAELPPLPNGASLRLVVGGRQFSGWDNCAGPLRWIALNGLTRKNGADAAIAWREPGRTRSGVWRGPDKVTGVARNLTKRYLDPRRAAA